MSEEDSCETLLPPVIICEKCQAHIPSTKCDKRVIIYTKDYQSIGNKTVFDIAKIYCGKCMEFKIEEGVCYDRKNYHIYCKSCGVFLNSLLLDGNTSFEGLKICNECFLKNLFDKKK